MYGQIVLRSCEAHPRRLTSNLPCHLLHMASLGTRNRFLRQCDSVSDDWAAPSTSHGRSVFPVVWEHKLEYAAYHSQLLID